MKKINHVDMAMNLIKEDLLKELSKSASRFNNRVEISASPKN